MSNRIAIPKDATHIDFWKDPEPEPEPEPAPVFPRGGWLGFEFCSNPEGFWPWAQKHGAIGCRFQTTGWHNKAALGRGFPAIIHLGPSNDPDQKVKDTLARRYAEYPATFGVHLWDETAWDDKARFWLDYIQSTYPDWKVFWGPFEWARLQTPSFYDAFHGVITYKNLTRRTRTTLDWTHQRALKNYYGQPVAYSVNPIDSSDAMLLADGAKYRNAMRDVARAFDGVFVWQAIGLWSVETGGAPQCPNPNDLSLILDALANVHIWQATRLPEEEGRKPLPVRFIEPGTEEGPPWRVDHTLACARTRVAWKAGFEPVASSELDACNPLEGSREPYGSNLRKMADWPRWTEEIQALVEAYEDGLAVQLRDRLGG